MALPTIQSYGDLKDVLQSWINRKDQRTLENIPLFINMAEKEIYRDLKIDEFIVTSIVPVSSNLEILAPIDVNKYKNLYFRDEKTGNVHTLSRVSLNDLNDVTKKGFSVTDRFILFTKDFKEGDQILIEYYKQQPFLKSDTDVTMLLTLAPDLIIYAALEIAARWSNDNDEIAKWSALRQQAMNSLKQRDDDKEYSGGAMVINSETGFIYGGNYGYY